MSGILVDKHLENSHFYKRNLYEMKNSLSRIALYVKKIRPIDLEIGKIKLLSWRKILAKSEKNLIAKWAVSTYIYVI